LGNHETYCHPKKRRKGRNMEEEKMGGEGGKGRKARTNGVGLWGKVGVPGRMTRH